MPEEIDFMEKLEFGRKYELIFKDRESGTVIYVVKLQNKGVRYRNVVVARGRENGKIKCWRFNDYYSLNKGKLRVYRGYTSYPSKLQEEFLERRLKSLEL
jgi:hypothetical protein